MSQSSAKMLSCEGRAIGGDESGEKQCLVESVGAPALELNQPTEARGGLG